MLTIALGISGNSTTKAYSAENQNSLRDVGF